MEGAIQKPSKKELKEYSSSMMENPYILRLAFSAGLGGLLFGYDTGVISGALLYIRDDFKSVDRQTVLQETIVSMAVAGAIVGAALGGYMNDRIGRKKSIMVADVLFFIGAIVMAVAPSPGIIILGRIFVGLGVGMASMTSPLYISEASPAKIRGALVATNGLLITAGQFLSYLINLAFTRTPGTWRWMLGVAGFPALLQFLLMFFLPESPRWLFRKNRDEEAASTLRKIYPPSEADKEIAALQKSVQSEREEKGVAREISISKLLKTKVIRRGLTAGIGLQVAQQFVGINSVMYYSPTIVQLAGFVSNETALALSLITSGLNVFGTIISMFFVDRTGRKRLMIISLIGIILTLASLTIIFQQSSTHSPAVGDSQTAHFGNFTCPNYKATPAAKWNCMSCLKASSDCGFCADSSNKLMPGACLMVNDGAKNACNAEDRQWYTRGCPNSLGWLALICLGLYIIFYAPGMGTVPWIVNSEIYPLKYRGLCGGIAATANWVSNLIVSQTFLSLTQALGTAYTFLLFGIFALISLCFVCTFVPETKGLSFEGVEKMLKHGRLGHSNQGDDNVLP